MAKINQLFVTSDYGLKGKSTQISLGKKEYRGLWYQVDKTGDFDDGANACVLMPWVKPFEPEQSYLQHKIDGTFINFGPEYGDTMHLFPGEEEIVRQWILDGALP